MLKAAHAMESREAAEAKALEVASGLGKPRLGEAAMAVRDGCAETPTHARFPRERWRRIGADDAIGRPNREIRRRTRAAGTFPGGRSALMLATARLKHVAESSWGSRRYLDATLLDGQPYRKAGRLGCRKVRKNLDGTVVIFVGWCLAALQVEVFGTDFYSWYFGVKDIPISKFGAFIPYIGVFILCFVVLSIDMNIIRRLPSTGNETKDTIIAIVVNVLLATAVVIIIVAVK